MSKYWLRRFKDKNGDTKLCLVPFSYEQENPGMYCNWARMNPYEERCLTCNRDCQHKGKHTII